MRDKLRRDWTLHTRNSHNLRSEVDNLGRVGPVKISWSDRQEKNTEWWPGVESIHNPYILVGFAPSKGRR